MLKYEIITWQDKSYNKRVRIEEFESTQHFIKFLSELAGEVIDSVKLIKMM